MELTPVQKEILNSLLTHYRKENGAVKGEKVAESIGRNPGTIRNQMQSLKALELIEGVPGPKGGYKPTSRAYKALDMDEFDEGEPVEVYKDGEIIDGATALEIDLTTLPQPDECKASIKILGDINVFNEGEEVEIGPTPVNKMYLKGIVAGKDEIGNELIIKIKEIHSIPKVPVEEIVSKNLITLDPEDTLKDVASIFIKNNIEGAPVISEGDVKGIITLTDLCEPFSKEETDKKAEKIMTKNTISISKDSIITEAIDKINKNDISRLVVLDDGEPIGIVTRTDIIKRLNPF